MCVCVFFSNLVPPLHVAFFPPLDGVLRTEGLNFNVVQLIKHFLSG